ncbi:hypothetical protein MXB_1527, partial [Myxobolus squamalis]
RTKPIIQKNNFIKIYYEFLKYVKAFDLSCHFRISSRAALYSQGHDRISNEFAIRTTKIALSIIKIKQEVFTDATFIITPAPFCQCIIFMTYNPKKNTYALGTLKKS